MNYRIIKILLISFVLFAGTAFASEQVNVYFFNAETCPHCADERPFLERLEEKYPEVRIYDFEITSNQENLELIRKIGQKLDINISSVPFTIVGEEYFFGWYDEEVTGSKIEEAVKKAINEEHSDLLEGLIDLPSENIPQKVNLPIVGEIDANDFSLPLLTIIIGGLDGFNPCAMWILILLISLLLGMKDRKRMWILGAVFIVTSGIVYFIFMAAWLNLLLFLGLVVWIRIIIGLIALFGAGYGIREYFKNRAVCDISGEQRKQKIFEKMKAITQKDKFILALIGIIILAFSVNLIELVCSAGLPAVYTQILAMSSLAAWQHYLYLLLYVFIFILDDLIVFIIAMVTLRLTGITTKYTRLSNLIGGILMLIIGLLLIFRPESLMFG